MRRAAPISALALAGVLALAGTGCGEPNDTTPDACLEGAGAYLSALDDAPGEVRLGGEVPISECLAENQKAGDLATVGLTMVATATRLSAEAQEDPRGPAGLRLGYLLGAAERGAEDTAGIHAELVRRLEMAASYSPAGRRLDPAFRRSYDAGLEAGRANG